MKKEKGTVLPISLIFLLVITLTASVSMSSVLTSQTLAKNTRDLDVAFQVAESGLVQGESIVSAIETLADAASFNKKSVYATNQSFWDTPITFDVSDQSTQDVEVVIEKESCSFIANNDHKCIFTITSRGYGTTNGEVILESTYIKMIDV